jgi:hypothetical protein
MSIQNVALMALHEAMAKIEKEGVDAYREVVQRLGEDVANAILVFELRKAAKIVKPDMPESEVRAKVNNSLYLCGLI